jgi:glutaredoxin
MIEVYGKEGCVFCDKALLLLDEHHKKYNYYKIDVDITLEEFKEKFPGIKTVPVVTTFGHNIGGYEALQAYIEETAGNYGH